MRYLGGGVGHYQVKVPDVADDEPEPPDEEIIAPSVPVHRADANEGSKSDSESDSDSSEEEDEAPEYNDGDDEHGDTLGPEDGEDGMEDIIEDLGYAAL